MAAAALRWAAQLAGDEGEVVVVHAAGLLDRLHRVADIEVWCAPLSMAGVAHRSLVVEGNPVGALLQAASDVDADVVVVGKRGSGGFPGLQLGSTSQELVAHATIPVVVVPGG